MDLMVSFALLSIAVIPLTGLVLYMLREMKFMKLQIKAMQNAHDQLSIFSLRHIRDHE